MADLEEEEVFEIVDFTSASEWEVFTSRLEEILLSWQLSLKDKEDTVRFVSLNGEWKSISEDINFAGHPFILTHHWIEEGPVSDDTKLGLITEKKGCQVFASLVENRHDFTSNCHLLAEVYGLSDFVIISPAGNEMLTTEDRINLLLSSITIAVNNIQSRVPVFVQIHSKSQQLYQGTFETKNLRTDFQMVHLKRIPSNCRHLSGLIELFKEKVGCAPLNPVELSVCWTYSLSDVLNLDLENWPQAPPDFESMGGVVGNASLGQLGFGAIKDPIKEIRVSAIWTGLNEDVVVDSEVYTDLDPVQAPLWIVRLLLTDQVPSLLIKSLCSFLDLCRSSESTEQLLGKNYTVLQSPDSPEYERALGALTKERSGYGLLSSNRLPFGGNKKAKTGGPIPENTMVSLLNFLFPDAEGDLENQTHPYPEQFLPDCSSSVDSTWKECFSAFKTSPVDSLVWRLGTAAVYTMIHLKGIEGVAHLWHEIVLELRFRWENGFTIPGLETGMPDLNYCRLYQKLQMLNCCIGHKKTATSGPPVEVADEDEFFDAEETLDSMEEKPRHSAWNQPQGRKERTKMKLIRSGETLYEPVTQEMLPMTEDMVEEQAEMMEQLGDNAQGSELRARILSASLLSDMEAFKAANPGAEMEDFVRWHSPRDWIEEEVVTSDGCKMEGRLSGRMQAPGNLWQEMWRAAKPVVAWRQKRLFDDTKEAEKILHTFSAIRPAQIATLLLPAIFHASVHRLLEELPFIILPDAISNCRAVISKIAQIARHSPLDLYQYEDLLPLLRQVEVHLSQYKSLRRRMADCGDWDGVDDFVTNLLINKDVSLPGGSHTPAGIALLQAFEKLKKKDTSSKLPPPIRKEFIFRTLACRPGSGSSPSCQRMYCCVDQDSIRLAGALTQDTLFY